MRRVWPALALGACLSPLACGGSGASTFSFALHTDAIPCDIPGLQAKLQISGQAEDCALNVGADRTITGECPGLAPGQVYECRLVYFILIGADEPAIELATALKQLDLSRVDGPTAQLSFDDASLNVEIDDDADQRNNLTEVCAGEDPRRT